MSDKPLRRAATRRNIDRMDIEQQVAEIIDSAEAMEPLERLKALATADGQFQRGSLLLALALGEQLIRYRADQGDFKTLQSWREFLESIGVKYHRASRLMRYARVFQYPEELETMGIDSQRKAEAACAYADTMKLLDSAGRGLYGEAQKDQVRKWLQTSYNVESVTPKKTKLKDRTSTPIEADLLSIIGSLQRAAMKAKHLRG